MHRLLFLRKPDLPDFQNFCCVHGENMVQWAKRMGAGLMSMERQDVMVDCLALGSVRFTLSHMRMSRRDHTEGLDLHSHGELELYLNLDGDISFLVGNKLYPLKRGDLIISRPGELHHSVYRSHRDHELFLFFIDLQNTAELDRFFREEITASFIAPEEAAKEEMIRLCWRLLQEGSSRMDRLCCLFSFLRLLKESAQGETPDAVGLPDDLTQMLAYIDQRLQENLSTARIANAFFLSESTVKRRFQTYLGITPLKFIQRRKMAYAAELLDRGESVMNAGIGAGYTDNSYFISLFRRCYGISPLQYKRRRKSQGTIEA